MSAPPSPRRLDALLLAPLSIAHRPLVIVPTGELHALPWSLLPPRAHARDRRPVAAAVVARDPAPATRTVLVAGPRLPAAAREIETLSRRHPHATALTGDEATVHNVSAALDGADSAHVAAHGRFRDDNPQFCSLELADGALTVYDLERLTQARRAGSCSPAASPGSPPSTRATS